MKTSELHYLRKQFRRENSLLRFQDVYSVYINGDTREILSTQYSPFLMLEEDMQGLLLKNAKKILTGKIDVKIFAKEFNDEFAGDGCYASDILGNILGAKKEDFVKQCNTLVQKLLKAYIYDKSMAVCFARATLYRKDGSVDFVFCTLNKAETPKEQLVYNADQGVFEYRPYTEPIVKMTAPLEGFMYPLFEDDSGNRNKILYYSSKSNKVNNTFIVNVLNCRLTLTAKQEKDYFHEILNELVGGKIKPVELYRVYDNIMRRFESEEDEDYRTLSPSVLKTVLEESDLTLAKDIEEVYSAVLGRTDYRFKVKNIVPDLSKKSISLGNSDTEINIKPDYLENVHQVQMDDGDIYLLIRLNENVSANGFNIDIEPVQELLK